MVVDRYIDNSKELAFELALEELEREQLNAKATEWEYKNNISNPIALYGAI